jgi:glycosyltransferase involved in cell wall biosynthesis
MRRQACQVSVVIPVYNSASTLTRAVNSVLRQTLHDIEVLIVDDASCDTSLAMAHELAKRDARIRVLTVRQNRGKSHAMNIAVNQAGGAWVAVLDADDWYEPTRLELLVSAAGAQCAELVADNQYFHDAAADRVVRTAFADGRARPAQALTRQAFVAGCDPYADFDYGMLKPIVRTDFIRRVGLTYRENTRLAEDFLYLVEFYAAGGRGTLVNQPLYHWTQPFGTLSRQWTTTGAGAWRYDFRSALTANADVLHELHRQQDRDLAELLTARTQAFKRLHHLSRISRMRACGSSWSRVMSVAVQHPAIWPLLAGRLLAAVRARPLSRRQRGT